MSRIIYAATLFFCDKYGASQLVIYEPPSQKIELESDFGVGGSLF